MLLKIILTLCHLAQDKEVWNLYELFHTRYTLHKRAYQHKTANALEEMLCDVLALANHHPEIRIPGRPIPGSTNGECAMLSPFDAIGDMFAYTKLTDSIFARIANSSSPGLLQSRELLRQVQLRRLYKYIGESVVKPGMVSIASLW